MMFCSSAELEAVEAELMKRYDALYKLTALGPHPSDPAIVARFRSQR